MTNKIPNGAEKHHESTIPEEAKQQKYFSSSFFRRTSSVWWFTHETAHFIHAEQCTTPSLFYNLEVSQGAYNHSLVKVWLPVWDAIFFIFRMQVLSMFYECLDLWVPPVFRQGELACHPSREGLSRCLNGCLGQWFFSQYCQIYLIPETMAHILMARQTASLWGQTSAAVWWQTSACTCACC